MLKKRILSAALACSMLLAMSAQAFALEDADLTATATVEVPTVAVTLPADLNFKMDPYNIAGKGQVIPGGVTNVAVLAGSTSTVPVDVFVKLSEAPTVGKDVTLVTALPTATSTTKEAYLFLRAVPADGKKTSGTDIEFPDPKVTKMTAATVTKPGDVLITKETVADAVLLCQFAPGKLGTNEPKKLEPAADKGQYGLGISGLLSANPASEWVSDDTVEAKFVFKFVPRPVAPPPVV